MSFDLQEIIGKMSVFAMLVVGVLGVMGVASLTIFVERLWTYWRMGRRARKFGPTAARLLETNDHSALAKASAKAPSNYLATMLEAGSETYLKTLEKPSKDVGPVELVRRELLRKADAQAAQLRRGLSVLASVGSTAPFVGLLGTVIGIIAAFQGIAAEGSGGLGAVSAGIAEALVVTAFGLLVAIPSVLIYNFLTTKSDSLLLSLDQFRGEYLDHLEARHSECLETMSEEPEPAHPAERDEVRLAHPMREAAKSAA